LTIDAIGHVTTGRAWPDGERCDLAGAVILSGEDDPEDTIVPRLNAAGADLKRVAILDGVRWRDPETKEIRIAPVDLGEHTAALREAITRTEARLLVIDPVSCYTGSRDDHKNAELREMLSALAGVARDSGCAIVCVSHLRKSGGLAVHAAVGSLAYGAAPRAVWAVLADPKDDTRRLFLAAKMNLAKKASGLAFCVVDGLSASGQPVLSWERDPVQMSADDVLNPVNHPGPPPVERDEAAEWLTIELCNGPREAADLLTSAVANGITAATLRRAKAELGIVASKSGFDGPWVWALPAAPQGAQP
jgi:hypothetical protein